MLSSSSLADFYRFAVLLAGGTESAERVMAETMAEMETRLGDLRSEERRRAWLVTRIRERCLGDHGSSEDGSTAPRLLRDPNPMDSEDPQEVLEIEAYIVAQRFRQLPEPERSALALFYLDLFPPAEIAQLLRMDLEELGEILSRARSDLRRLLNEKA